MNVQRYKSKLTELTPLDLDHKPISEIDIATNNLIKSIMEASDENSPTTSVITVKQYDPTPKIKRLLKHPSFEHTVGREK